MKRKYTIEIPAPFEVEFNDDEQRAIGVSRAQSLVEVLERHWEMAMVFSRADAVVLVAALRAFVEKGMNRAESGLVPPADRPPKGAP